MKTIELGSCTSATERKEYKERETIKLIRTERDGSQGVFEKITENWVIEKKYKYFATCIRKVRNGVIRQSFSVDRHTGRNSRLILIWRGEQNE